MKSSVYLYILMVTMFSLSCDVIKAKDCECGEPLNVWYKLSNAPENYGEIVALDMSHGQSFSDGRYIYLIILDKISNEQVVLYFPDGGNWITERDNQYDELEKEMMDLEEYLKRTQDKSYKLEK